MDKDKSILVIDDELSFHEALKFLLEPMGFTIHSAYNGLEGLRFAVENDYRIVFLDVHMPKMQGPEVLQKLKERKPNQAVVIFSSSSDPSQKFERKANDLGAFCCLYKPFDADQILKVIETAIRA